MFYLKDKMTGEVEMIYSVRSKGEKTEFLIYVERYGFVWNDSSYFEPR